MTIDQALLFQTIHGAISDGIRDGCAVAGINARDQAARPSLELEQAKAVVSAALVFVYGPDSEADIAYRRLKKAVDVWNEGIK